jgi:hypothetical protein
MKLQMQKLPDYKLDQLLEFEDNLDKVRIDILHNAKEVDAAHHSDTNHKQYFHMGECLLKVDVGEYNCAKNAVYNWDKDPTDIHHNAKLYCRGHNCFDKCYKCIHRHKGNVHSGGGADVRDAALINVFSKRPGIEGID